MQYQNPIPNKDLQAAITTANQSIQKVVANVEQVIKGKRKVIEDVLISIIANGHVLLLDVPGVGKTALAKAIAKSIHSDFKRIQFTPDLLPTDVSGVNIFNPKTREFEFKEGPIFTNILLADEINRTSPKTQAALLEAMEERQVTIDNTMHKLPDFFFVIATQNPIEHAGTYPLPAAQLDRFLMRVTIGYPDKETERIILNLHTADIKPIDQIQPVVETKEILNWQHIANNIYTAPVLDDYMINLAQATRANVAGGHGVSPRATLLLKKAARATAMLLGRDYVIPDDIQRVIKAVFAHRLVSEGKVGDALVEEIVQRTAI